MKKENRSKQTLNELYKIDFDNFYSYPKNYPKYLPKRNDPKYTNINTIEDYEFTNCIAFEMLIRTKKYKKLMNLPDKNIDTKWKDKMQKLGLDSAEAISIKKSLHDISLFKGLPFSSPIQQDMSFLTIADIDNGLETLIEYYLKKKELYLIKRTTNHPIIPNMLVNEYSLAYKATIKSVLKNLDKYFIPCQLNQKKCQLSSPLYIINLEEDFIQTIADKISKHKNIKFHPIFKRPQLRFEESRIVEININLDLPKKELTAYIEKIKDEYDKNKFIAKNVLDILIDHDDNEETKHLITIKKNLSSAFFCYDFYKAKKDYIMKVNEEVKIENESNVLIQEKRNNIKLLQNDLLQYKNRPKTIELENLKEQIISLELEIEDELKKFKKLPSIKKDSPNYVFKDKAFEKSKINSNTAYYLYTKLAPYIDKLYYKHLLIGNR